MSGQPLPVKKLSQSVNAVISRLPGMPRARSKDFYWETSVFLVDDVLFRVPRYQFIENSETFRAMFTLPQAETDTVEGDSDDKPIQLQGVSKVDFERLLKFMYPQNGLSPREISHEEWISILKLSTMWEMTEIRNTAISDILERQLKIDATERISLGREYDVPALTTSGIVDLVNQRGGVSEEQIAVLGFEMALRIQCIRVKLLENRARQSVFSGPSVRAVARTIFHGEWSFEEPVQEEFYSDECAQAPGSSRQAVSGEHIQALVRGLRI
ncbi:uncharacterized protein ARMOST_01282 [Armillaria ostoyae]|uniref:BTB domain-containing protein n=1 Tax=Armillaria ostoyae TaxID=47428 RepID=A0A284QNI7_ARMOS|nr:uncharacterized protein ARMOST_01282 [Armillaria ostoyae]